ncbi:Transposon Ty4-J Gag-Pol polyprotein [Durusdinium trenchii]|uniref:Transposon Ty4-J Gag-Pol polyprotein n=1 Tax=Durusdinium trenchii TaxID=1381693 RepID=A0ABP0LKD6_9DINO
MVEKQKCLLHNQVLTRLFTRVSMQPKKMPAAHAKGKPKAHVKGKAKAQLKGKAVMKKPTTKVMKVLKKPSQSTEKPENTKPEKKQKKWSEGLEKTEEKAEENTEESTEGPEEEVATCDEVVDPNTNFSMPKETDQKKDRSKNAKLKQCSPLERFQNGLKRRDQCQFGLVDHTNGMPHMKATGFLTATDQVNNNLSKRCNWEHVRSPLEGSNKTKRAQVWPRRLCEVILKGFISELEERSLFSAFAGEFSTEIEEEETPLGQLDAIYDEKDVSKSTIVTAKTTEEEIQRLESIEEDTTLGDSTSLEATRRQKWLKADRAIRVALRRLRSMTGHCSTSAMVQLLRTAGAPQPTLEAARHFACETCRKTQKVEPPNRVKAPNKPTFNWEISCDAFEVKDSKGNRHIVLSSLPKDLIKSIAEEKQVVGIEEMEMVIMEAVTVKNNRLHHHGFTPSQWVLGRLPREVCSLTANEEDQENLGVHQGIDDPVDEFTRQLEIRQAAKRVLAKQLLELRPSRKRRRRDYDDLPAKEALPFSEDLVVPALQGDDDGYVQPGYVEIPTEAGGTELSYLPSVGPPDQEEAETPFQLLPELPSVPESTDAEVEEIPAPTSLEREMSAQPESEASCAPTVPPTPPATPMSSGTLQTALNRSVDQLDGYPRPEIPFLPPPGLERERSRSPARSPAANLQCLMMKEV